MCELAIANYEVKKERGSGPDHFAGREHLPHLAGDRLALDGGGHQRPEVPQEVLHVENAVGITVERFQVRLDHRTLLLVLCRWVVGVHVERPGSLGSTGGFRHGRMLALANHDAQEANPGLATYREQYECLRGVDWFE
jgi:hypothetical protein